MVVLLLFVLMPNVVLCMCPEPDPVINAYRYKDDMFLEEGSWLNYSCYMNYVHYSGDLARQCSSGYFTGQTPVCIYSCGPPPKITSMLTQIPELTVFGSMVNYTCQFNTSIMLTAVCDANFQKWIYDDTVICPQPGNLFELLMFGTDLENWASIFHDNRTDTCRQSNVSSQPNIVFTMLETVDLKSISVTFGAFTGARGPVIVKLLSQSDQSNTTHIIDTCGGIFENLYDNETIFIECSSPINGVVINVYMVLDPSQRGLLTVCEFQTVGNLRNEGCYGQPKFSYGAEIISRNDSVIQQKCVAGFYWFHKWEIVKCNKRNWLGNNFECAQRDDLLPMQAYDAQHSYAFDQITDTCQKLNKNSVIMGGDAQNRTFIVLSVTIILLDYITDNTGIKVINSNGDQSECYFTNLSKKVLLCDFEDDTEATTIVFYHNSTSIDVVHLCELYVNGFFKDTNEHECYRNHPSNYQGKMSFTWNDLICERWDQVPSNLNLNFENLPDDSVKNAENYCRNPDNSALVPWCFVKNYTKRENCMVQKCSLFCSLSPDGTDYEGKQTLTSSTDTCVYWSNIEDTNKVQGYKKDFYTNRCTNFGDSFSSPWCFTDISGQSFGACSLIHCAKTINTINVSKPSMLFQNNIHPYCYWNRNANDTVRPFNERFEFHVTSNTLQTRCSEGVNSIFCYGENDFILTHYHVDSCDVDATPDPSIHSLNSGLSFNMYSTPKTNAPNVNNLTKKVSVNGSTAIIQGVSNLTNLKLPNLTDLPLNLADELCNCLCVESQILDNVTLDKRIEDIIVSLSIEKSNLTRVLRRKISAIDKRPSAMYIGSGAVAIFSIFILLVISPDIIYLVEFISNVMEKCRKTQHTKKLSTNSSNQLL